LDWSELLNRHGPALVLYARQWTGTHADAEEAVQNGFVRAWKSIPTCDNPLPRLYLSVRSSAIDLVRSRERRKAREKAVATDSDSVSWFDSRLETAERNDAIEAALKALPLEQREVVVMKVWGDLTFPDIGQALGIPANTAASRYRYALAKLAESIPEELRNAF
jgi:RNA polymerase sigma-70 factor (ECF subfamily)